MDIRSVLFFGICLNFPVQGQVFDSLPHDFILIVDSNGTMYRMDMNNHSYEEIPTEKTVTTYDIDYDPIDGVIFRNEFTAAGLPQITSVSLYGTNQKSIRLFSITALPYGMAVDAISRLLFYVDAGNRIIAVLSLKDYLHKTIISSGLSLPRYIVTDPIHGTIYWIDRASPAKIEKSNYNGTNRQVLITAGLTYPSGLALDIIAGVIYWCDGGTIQRANVNGSNRQIIYQTQGIEETTYSSALYQSYLYFTYWASSRSVMRIGKDGNGVSSVGPSAFEYIMDIYVRSNGTAPPGINGCSNGNSSCSHFCFPLPGGSNVCACPDGMILQPDGQTCGNDSLPHDFLIIVDSNGTIYRMDMNTHSYEKIPTQKPVTTYDIDYDPIDGIIFRNEFTAAGLPQITSVSIDGTNQKSIRSFKITAEPYGMAVDVISRLLFYVDAGNHIIAVISLKDYLHKTIISSGLGVPRYIVTDPTHGTIYWIDRASPAKIEKSNYNGTNRQVLITAGLTYPSGLALDIVAGVIYWCDAGTIQRANVNGSNRQTIYQTQGIEVTPYSSALYQSYLYFTYWGSSRSVMRIGKDGNGLSYVGPSAFEYIMDIYVRSNGTGIPGINGCSNGSSSCSHFCFPLPDGSNMCACPDGMILQPDGQTCGNADVTSLPPASTLTSQTNRTPSSSEISDYLPENFLLILDYIGAIYRMDINNHTYEEISIQKPVSTYDIDYDPIDGVIFRNEFTDAGLRQISSASVYGTNQQIIRSLNSTALPYGIAVDAISKLLFYADAGNHIIAVISLKDYLHKTVISSNLGFARYIVTDPIHGTIFWIDRGSPGKIEKSNYNGTNRQVLIHTGLSLPSGLSLDIIAGIMYWCDAGTIQRANMDGSNRQIIYRTQGTEVTPYSSALYQSYLYFTYWGPRSVMRIGKNGSGLTSVSSSTFGYILDIYAHSKVTGTNGCSNGSGGCSHFCFPSSDGSKVCACPDDMTLQSDGQTCRDVVAPLPTTSSPTTPSSSGLTEELIILRAAVGSLAGLLVISVLLNVCFIRICRRMKMEKKEELPPVTQVTTGDEHEDYHTISATDDTEIRNIQEVFPAFCNRTVSNKLSKPDGYLTPNIYGVTTARDYIECI